MSAYSIISKLAEMNGITILKSLGYSSNKGIPKECVSGHKPLCVLTSAVNTQDSAVHLPTVATEDSDLILPQGLCTSSFPHSEPLPLVLAKPSSFLSFKFQFKCQLLRNALSDACPNSVGPPLLWSPPHPLCFLCQLLLVRSLCLPLGAKLLEPSLFLYHCVSSIEQDGM